DRGPAKPARTQVTCDAPGGDPRKSGRDGADEREEDRDTAIASQREGQRHQSGKPGGMNRVDLTVAAALQEVGVQIAGVERVVVAAAMVVLDLEVVIAEQTLCDDEVMGLVSSRQLRGNPPGRDHIDKARDAGCNNWSAPRITGGPDN